MAEGDGAALVGAVDTLRQLGLSASGTLEELASALQRMAVIQSVPSMASTDDPDDATWRRLAPLLAPDETQLFYSLCLQGRAELALAPDEYSGLVMLMLRLLAFKPGNASAKREGEPPPKAEGSAAGAQRAEPLVSEARPAVSVRAMDAPAAPSQPPAPSAPPRPAVNAPPSGQAHSPLPPSGSPMTGVQATPAASAQARQSPGTPAMPPRPSAATDAPSGTGQSLPPWEALPPEAEAAFMNDEPSAYASDDIGFDELPPARPRSTQAARPHPSAPAANAASAASTATPAEPAPRETRRISIQLPPPGADPLSDAWADIVSQLHAKGAITALVRELAIQSQCVGRETVQGGTLLRLRIERESLRTDTNRERLRLALAQHLGHEVTLEMEKGAAANTPAQRDQVAREMRLHQAEDLIEGDPLVRQLLSQYPGSRIVPGSIRPL